MIQQITIPEPLRISVNDQELIETWRSNAAAKAAAVAAERAAALKKENEELTAEAEERMTKSRSKYDRQVNNAYKKGEKAHDEKQAEAKERHEKKVAETGSDRSRYRFRELAQRGTPVQSVFLRTQPRIPLSCQSKVS